MAGAIPHTYRYAFPSSLNATAIESQVRLATSGGTAEFPFFFKGALKQPRLTAHLLRVLSKVVGARFHIPSAMLARILRECDPVVTSGGGLLRFEGFSACGSAYARVDLNPDAYVGVVVAQGTTNVDFNAPFRAALAQIRDHERVGFAVGADEVALLRGTDQIIERKGALPLRWLKSFVEVQSYQSRMEQRAGLGKIETLRFLRSLPRTTMAKTAFWIQPAGAGLRVSQRVSVEGIRIAGIERLRILEELAPFADGLSVYANPRGTASEWQLGFGPLRFSLTLSPDVWRGFSGEGQGLSDLVAREPHAVIDGVRQALKWQAELRAEDFAANGTATLDSIRRGLTTLGSRGLVGYDLARGAYFHRELPFDLALVEELHPRLAGARELVAKAGVVVLRQSDDVIEAEVPGTGVVHRVRLSTEGDRCTCMWHAKHQGGRGPCKHILAVQLHAEGQATAAHAADAN
jgi:hypothetical protein